MRRFRLNTGLLLFLLALFAGISVWFFTKWQWATGCLMLIASGACVAGIWHLQTDLIRMMSVFVSALEMNDTTFRVEAGGDAELRQMSASMNRLSQLYRSGLRELETRKLYYDRILRIMTHEMRNGITPLIAITADMKAHPGRYKDELLAEACGLMHSQAEGVRRFLDSYYNLTHIPEPNMEPVRATTYFGNLRQFVRSELQQRGLPDDMVSFTVPDGMELIIDTALMNQVMLNLVRNALDALEGRTGGRVEVVLTVSDQRPYLTVTDNGDGIPDEIMANLFQPFYTTKERGTGIGLCLCRQIIRKHGGELNIRSKPGRGTVLIMTL